MPQKPKHPCYQPGCNELTRERYCEKHKWSGNKNRSSSKMGYGAWWRKERKSFLERNPLCVECGRLANVVDHRIPHKGDESLFYNQSNWQPMCTSCHNRKTRLEDMGGWTGKLGGRK